MEHLARMTVKGDDDGGQLQRPGTTYYLLDERAVPEVYSIEET
jgi:hypothetical protein